MTEEIISTKWHFRQSQTPRFIFFSVVSLALLFVIAWFKKDWAYFARSGSIVTWLGVILSCRRLFRKGIKANEENQPLVINRNQFNTAGMWERVQDGVDAYAQIAGLWLVSIGTLISIFGDLLMNWVFPFK